MGRAQMWGAGYKAGLAAGASPVAWTDVTVSDMTLDSDVNSALVGISEPSEGVIRVQVKNAVAEEGPRDAVLFKIPWPVTFRGDNTQAVIFWIEEVNPPADLGANYWVQGTWAFEAMPDNSVHSGGVMWQSGGRAACTGVTFLGAQGTARANARKFLVTFTPRNSATGISPGPIVCSTGYTAAGVYDDTLEDRATSSNNNSGTTNVDLMLAFGCDSADDDGPHFADVKVKVVVIDFHPGFPS